MYFVDDGYIWKLNPLGAVTVFAGSRESVCVENCRATEVSLATPWGVATDAFDNVYVAERSGHRVRKIDPTGIISTLAGTGTQGYSGDGGPATEAQLARPTNVAVDPFGNVYVADEANHRIRMIDSDGQISTLAGTGVRGDAGDYGPASQFQLSYPNDVATDSFGNVYVSQRWPNRVRKIDFGGNVTTLLWSIAVEALAVDNLGDVYVGGEYRMLRLSGDGDESH